MVTTADGDAYAAWRVSLTVLTGGLRELEAWQDQRYKFAHRVGELLAAEHSGQEPVTGPVLYGVYLAGTGLAYVGQTEQSGRRLRDLPIGESHHLANTVPPEIWERVVVLQWPNVLGCLPFQEQQHAIELGPKICGLVLEHQIQLHEQPPLNSRRRQRDGQWRRRQLAESRSLGAVHAGNLPNLYERVQEAWDELAGAETPADAEPVHLSAFGRAVFPSALL